MNQPAVTAPNGAPDHHVRYTRAWALHQDEDTPTEARRILEREMDEAQSAFTWEEFHEFKKSLPGFVEHWKEIAKQLLHACP